MDPMSMMAIMNVAGKAGGTITEAVGRGARAIGGTAQILVGLYQLRQARKLPFPSYTSGMQYANENMEMYRRQYREGLGNDMLGGVRKETSSQTAKTLRSLSETSPQFGGQAASRVSAMDRMSTEANLAQLDRSFRQNALGGLTRAAAEKSQIQQRQVSADRQYKLMAEQAAGQAIAQGSENLVQGAEYMSYQKENKK